VPGDPQGRGDKIELMIDPLGLYDRRGALKVGKVLDELNFYWYEEPLPESDVEGYIELCRRLDVPIVGVDSLRLSLGNYADYIARELLTLCKPMPPPGNHLEPESAALAEAFAFASRPMPTAHHFIRQQTFTSKRPSIIPTSSRCRFRRGSSTLP